jgi:hypothetical protein
MRTTQAFGITNNGKHFAGFGPAPHYARQWSWVAGKARKYTSRLDAETQVELFKCFDSKPTTK